MAILSHGSKAEKDEAAADSRPDAPFRARFKAWWGGYYLPGDPRARATARKGKAADNGEADGRGKAADDGEADGKGKASGRGKGSFLAKLMPWKKPKNKAEAADAAAVDRPDAPADEPSEPLILWSPSRLAITQRIWGEGCNLPGSEEYVLDMVKPLSLNQKMKLLEVGAGLGGAARIITKATGAWVTGLEADAAAAEEGQALSVKAGLKKKAAIIHFVAPKLGLKSASIDRVLSRETFFAVKDKEALLQVIENVMKPGGQLLFTDYVVDEAGRKSAALDQWKAAEPVPPKPWSMSEYTNAMTAMNLEVRVHEDVTEAYCQMILGSWRHFTEILKRDVTEEAAATVLAEVELWGSRMAAFESGDLKVFRFFVLKGRDE